MRNAALWRKVVDELRADADRSDREIARVAGCSQPFVGSVRTRWEHDRAALEDELADPFDQLNRFLDGLADKEVDPRLQQILDERATSPGYPPLPGKDGAA